MTSKTSLPTDEIQTEIPAEDASAQTAQLQGSLSQPAEFCTNCGSIEPWGLSSWCPVCGFYPKLGKCIETSPGLEAEVEEFKLMKLVPGWVWILGAGVVAITGLSILARMGLVGNSVKRSLWSLSQCGIGVSVAFVAHFTALMFAMPDTDRFSPFDIFMKPIEIWTPAFRALPKNAWRFWLLAWGLTAVFCALAIVGGIRYSGLFDDWGVAKPGEVNVLQRIVQQSRVEKEGADSLEDAVNDFIGDAAPKKDDEKQSKKILTVDCLIFGYTKTDDDRFSSLLLATVVKGELRYVGRLSAAGIPLEMRHELMDRMRTLQRDKPFVKSPYPATWLKPRLMCRVAYQNWTPNQRLRRAVFQEMLSDVHID